MTISKETEKQFGRLFANYLQKRLTELSAEYTKTEKFLELSAQESRICSSLERMTAPPVKELLEEYRDLLCDIMVEQQNFFYKQGLVDFGRVLEIYAGILKES